MTVVYFWLIVAIQLSYKKSVVEELVIAECHIRMCMYILNFGRIGSIKVKYLMYSMKIKNCLNPFLDQIAFCHNTYQHY